jgi:hypothetical protein
MEFKNREAQFEIVFWKGSYHRFAFLQTCADPRITYSSVNRHATLQTGGPQFVTASRTLARCLLFRHLMQLDISVHVFEDLEDPSWVQYEATKKVTTKR